MIDFLHTFEPTPVLIAIGSIKIYWYGFFIVLGVIAAIFTTMQLAPFYGIKKDDVIDLAFYLIIFGILGARLYDVLLEISYYKNFPLDIFKIWQGGLAIHGGIIAGLITIYFYAKKHPLDKGRFEAFLLYGAIIAPGLALAQAIGRWGNYFNSELFGYPTNLPWGIPINILRRPNEFYAAQYFHPTFLYESIGNFVIFLILVSLHYWIIKNKNKETKVNRYALCVTSYAILYSLLRFFLEFIRIDKTPTFFGLRWPQIASLAIIIISSSYLLKYFKKPVNVNNSSHTNTNELIN